MKRLILIRHASAEPTGESGDDFGRKLTESGHKELILLGNKLVHIKIIPDIIISSSAARALDTAGHIAGILGCAKTIIRHNKSLFQGPAPQDFLKLLDDIGDDIGTVALVGHNPNMSEFGWYLCRKFHEIMPRASAAGFGFEKADWSSLIPGRGKLLFYLKAE